MGGMIGTLNAKTLADLMDKVEELRRKGRALGLVDEKAFAIKFDPAEGEWLAFLWIHS